jgi:hypothetical protein
LIPPLLSHFYVSFFFLLFTLFSLFFLLPPPTFRLTCVSPLAYPNSFGTKRLCCYRIHSFNWFFSQTRRRVACHYIKKKKRNICLYITSSTDYIHVCYRLKGDQELYPTRGVPSRRKLLLPQPSPTTISPPLLVIGQPPSLGQQHQR